MPYTTPTFNLTCNIYTSADHTVPPRVSGAICNLAWGKRVNVPSTGGTGSIGVPLITMTLLLPPHTDIRGTSSTTGGDAVEVPAGSGRYYYCAFADLIGAGFANAHKGATLQQEIPFKTPDT